MYENFGVLQVFSKSRSILVKNIGFLHQNDVQCMKNTVFTYIN